MAISFEDRVALVTGAGTGLGRSHALMLAARGASVVVNDPATDAEGRSAAQAVVNEIVEAGGKAAANTGSVASKEAAQEMVDQAISEFGRLDILINNAGILRDRSFAKSDMDDFDLVIAVHLLGSAYCSRAAFPVMKEQNFGRIIMTTSNSGLYGNFGQANYAAAKAGLVGLMNTLAIEGAKNNILVNSLAPMAATAMTEGGMPQDLLDRFHPEYASAGALVLASENFSESGVILSAAAGHFARVRITSSPGIQFSAESVSPEEVLDKWADISAASDSVEFGNAQEEVAYVAERTVPSAA